MFFGFRLPVRRPLAGGRISHLQIRWFDRGIIRGAPARLLLGQLNRARRLRIRIRHDRARRKAPEGIVACALPFHGHNAWVAVVEGGDVPSGVSPIPRNYGAFCHGPGQGRASAAAPKWGNEVRAGGRRAGGWQDQPGPPRRHGLRAPLDQVARQGCRQKIVAARANPSAARNRPVEQRARSARPSLETFEPQAESPAIPPRRTRFTAATCAFNRHRGAERRRRRKMRQTIGVGFPRISC